MDGLVSPSARGKPTAMQFDEQSGKPSPIPNLNNNTAIRNNNTEPVSKQRTSLQPQLSSSGQNFHHPSTSSSPQPASPSSTLATSQQRPQQRVASMNDDHCDTNDRVYNNINHQAADSCSPPSPQSSCNSSYSSKSGKKLMNNSSSSIVSAEVPGGVVTTQNISTVIKPKSNNNSLQFVKIQTPELSKKASEQIRIAEETKSSKEKIKEVEEEWQNNLLNWKSKRRQQFSHSIEQEPENENQEPGSGRKIKTFAEMIEQRAKSNNRLGAFHLKRYIGSGDDEEEEGEEAAIPAAAGEPVARQLFSEHHHQHQDRAADLETKNLTHDEDSESHSSKCSSHIQQTPLLASSQQSDYKQHKLRDDNSFSQQHHEQQRESPQVRCDNQQKLTTISTPPELADRHSISLVAHSLDSEQMNSTLKPGVNPSPINKRDVPLLDVDTKTREVVSVKDDHNDESDNSCYEEDEEEEEHEEEQKHLQRIAFVAKLKAFENLTKPTSQAPKSSSQLPPPLPPSRLAKGVAQSMQPKDPRRQNVLQLQKESSLPVEKKQAPIPTAVAPIVRPIVKADRSSSNSSMTTSSPELKSEGSTGDIVSSRDIDARSQSKPIGRPTPPSKEFLNPASLPQVRSNIVVNRMEQVSPSKQTVIAPQPKILVEPRRVLKPLESSKVSDMYDGQDLASRISNIDINRHQADDLNSMQQVIPEPEPTISGRSQVRNSDNDYNKLSYDDFDSRPNAHELTSSMGPSSVNAGDRDSYLNDHHSMPYNHQSTAQMKSQATGLQLQHQKQPGTPNLSQLGYMQNDYHMSSSPHQREMPSPRLPKEHQHQLPIKSSLPHTNMSNNTSSVNQRKLPTTTTTTTTNTTTNSLKEDKERPPPLQVSGKKRCSSCKEELGRGAAAFVVESLSLVYHTNCFRCSVCHANLSNGFRGVDVRVHAGALHCQNCYSKDGLNYSRV